MVGFRVRLMIMIRVRVSIRAKVRVMIKILGSYIREVNLVRDSILRLGLR